MFNTLQLAAQDDTEYNRPAAPEFAFTTIPVRCILRDINLGFAHRIGSVHTLEGRVGWVHPDHILHKYYNLWLNSSEMRFQGPSVYIQLNKWRINKIGRHIFLGCVAGYRYLWYEDKQLTVYDPDGRSYDEDITLSQWRNDFIVLGTIGITTTKFSMSEISVGLRFMFTHTHVSKTKNYYPGWTQQQYDEYVDATMDRVPNDEGFGMMPIIRITSRFGWFEW